MSTEEMTEAEIVEFHKIQREMDAKEKKENEEKEEKRAFFKYVFAKNIGKGFGAVVTTLGVLTLDPALIGIGAAMVALGVIKCKKYEKKQAEAKEYAKAVQEAKKRAGRNRQKEAKKELKKDLASAQKTKDITDKESLRQATEPAKQEEHKYLEGEVTNIIVKDGKTTVVCGNWSFVLSKDAKRCPVMQEEIRVLVDQKNEVIALDVKRIGKYQGQWQNIWANLEKLSPDVFRKYRNQTFYPVRRKER